MLDPEIGPDAEHAPPEIRLFGPFDLRVNGGPVGRFRSKKVRWLLALLALRSGREVERSWLAGTLWPEIAEGPAYANLRLCLMDLRRALGPSSARLSSPSRTTLRLDLSGADVDVPAFDDAVRRGDPGSLERAVSLYRGPLLEGCLEEWVAQEREARARACLSALERLAEHARSIGNVGAAAGHLRRAIVLDPLRETTRRSLMEALASAGCFAEAIQAYRDLRLVLHREMRAEPDPRTTALFRTIQKQARESMAVPSEPAAPAPSPIRRLPAPLTSLIGREKETEQAIACMGASRLVTLTGTGGIGKTRLALRVAETVAEEYPDGVWFVDLSGLSDASLVAPAVASALEVREGPGRGLTAALSEFMRSRRLLLLLDNCEHLLDECATVVDRLLHDCLNLRILATSREGLRVSGEAIYPVRPFPLPDREVRLSAERLNETPVVRLFIERARAVSPGFSLTEANSPAIVEICRRLSGIPLAIELAAARANTLPLERIAARLEKGFRLLTGGSRTALPRQQTLQGALDWSHNLLTEPERAVFRRLSVFAGGWTLEAVEAVCSGEGVDDEAAADLLAGLVSKSLVLYDGESGRYRWLEVVRQYARERLIDAGEGERVRDRHLAHYGEEGHLQDFYDRDDDDNLLAALDHFESGDRPAGDGMGVLERLLRQWWAKGRIRYAQEVFERCRPRVEASDDPFLRARYTLAMGVLAFLRDDVDRARERFERAVAAFRSLGTEAYLADGLAWSGWPLYASGDYRQSRERFEESYRLFDKIGDRHGRCHLRFCLGLVLIVEGDLKRSRDILEATLAECGTCGDDGVRWGVMDHLALIDLMEGRWREALEGYRRALAMQWNDGERGGLPYHLRGVAEAVLEGGDWEQGVLLLSAAERWALELETGMALYPRYRSDALERAKTALGEAAFAACWAEGQSMTLEELVETALSTGPRSDRPGR